MSSVDDKLKQIDEQIKKIDEELSRLTGIKRSLQAAKEKLIDQRHLDRSEELAKNNWEQGNLVNDVCTI